MSYPGRVMEVNGITPHLDLVVEALEAMAASDGPVRIVTGFSRQNTYPLGLLTDVTTSLNQLCPNAKVEAIVAWSGGHEDSVLVSGYRGESARRYKVKIIFEEGRPFRCDRPPYADQEQCLVFSEDEKLGRVSVDMFEGGGFEPPRLLLDRLSGEGIIARDLLPAEKKRMVMKSSFGTYVYTDLGYQDVDGMRSSATVKPACETKEVKHPVSTRGEYCMSTAAYRLFRDPLLWTAISSTISNGLSLASGDVDIDTIARQRGETAAMVEARMESMRNLAYMFVDGAANGRHGPERFKRLLAVSQCPPEYRKMLIDRASGCLRHLAARPDGKGREYCEKIADAHNTDMQRYGGSRISADDLIGFR